MTTDVLAADRISASQLPHKWHVPSTDTVLTCFATLCLARETLLEQYGVFIRVTAPDLRTRFPLTLAALGIQGQDLSEDPDIVRLKLLGLVPATESAPEQAPEEADDDEDADERPAQARSSALADTYADTWYDDDRDYGSAGFSPTYVNPANGLPMMDGGAAG